MPTKRKGFKRQKAGARALLSAQRRVEAIALRRSGKTYAEIGEALGISGTAAHKIVTHAIDDLNAQFIHETHKLRQDQLDQLLTLKAALWKSACKGEVTKVDRLIRIMEREAKLAGLDAPDQFEHTGGGGSPLLAPVIMIPKASDD